MSRRTSRNARRRPSSSSPISPRIRISTAGAPNSTRCGRAPRSPSRCAPCGRLTRAAGLVLEAVGLRLASAPKCMIELPAGSSLPMAEAEVVGFSGDKLFLMPTTEVSGLLPGARVYPLESAPIADPMAGAKRLPVGWDLLGRVVDASGRPLDGLGPLGAQGRCAAHRAGHQPAGPRADPQGARHRRARDQRDADRRPRPAHRPVRRLRRRQIVLLGMMARYTSADVIVVGLIGERGREVKEFIEEILGEEGLARSVVVAAPADVAAAAAHAGRDLRDRRSPNTSATRASTCCC